MNKKLKRKFRKRIQEKIDKGEIDGFTLPIDKFTIESYSSSDSWFAITIKYAESGNEYTKSIFLPKKYSYYKLKSKLQNTLISIKNLFKNK